MCSWTEGNVSLEGMAIIRGANNREEAMCTSRIRGLTFVSRIVPTCQLAILRPPWDCKAQALAYRPSVEAAEVQKVRWYMPDGQYVLHVVVVT